MVEAGGMLCTDMVSTLPIALKSGTFHSMCSLEFLLSVSAFLCRRALFQNPAGPVHPQPWEQPSTNDSWKSMHKYNSSLACWVGMGSEVSVLHKLSEFPCGIRLQEPTVVAGLIMCSLLVAFPCIPHSYPCSPHRLHHQ